jgi:hypothetical protein
MSAIVAAHVDTTHERPSAVMWNTGMLQVVSKRITRSLPLAAPCSLLPAPSPIGLAPSSQASLSVSATADVMMLEEASERILAPRENMHGEGHEDRAGFSSARRHEQNAHLREIPITNSGAWSDHLSKDPAPSS